MDKLFDHPHVFIWVLLIFQIAEAPYGSLPWRESSARPVAFRDADIGLGRAIAEFFLVFANHIITTHIIAQPEHNVKS